MKITLNIPDNMQGDLVKLGSKMEIPIEKVVVTVMAVGTQVINDCPQMIQKYKDYWRSTGRDNQAKS